MTRSSEHCQYHYGDLLIQTSPDTRVALPLRRHWWRLKTHVWHISTLGPRKFMERIFPTTKLGRAILKARGREPACSVSKESLGLKAGELVEVKSVKEIFATLDQHGKLKGLAFNAEQARFCGGRFKVYKRLENIILESTGERRRIRTPTVLLEGVLCDGEEHGKCDRSCFCFWREAWLQRVPTSNRSDRSG